MRNFIQRVFNLSHLELDGVISSFWTVLLVLGLVMFLTYSTEAGSSTRLNSFLIGTSVLYESFMSRVTNNKSLPVIACACHFIVWCFIVYLAPDTISTWEKESATLELFKGIYSTGLFVLISLPMALAFLSEKAKTFRISQKSVQQILTVFDSSKLSPSAKLYSLQNSYDSIFLFFMISIFSGIGHLVLLEKASYAQCNIFLFYMLYLVLNLSFRLSQRKRTSDEELLDEQSPELISWSILLKDVPQHSDNTVILTIPPNTGLIEALAQYMKSAKFKQLGAGGAWTLPLIESITPDVFSIDANNNQWCENEAVQVSIKLVDIHKKLEKGLTFDLAILTKQRLQELNKQKDKNAQISFKGQLFIDLSHMTTKYKQLSSEQTRLALVSMLSELIDKPFLEQQLLFYSLKKKQYSLLDLSKKLGVYTSLVVPNSYDIFVFKKADVIEYAVSDPVDFLDDSHTREAVLFSSTEVDEVDENDNTPPVINISEKSSINQEDNNTKSH